jgi:hypothetical protein
MLAVHLPRLTLDRSCRGSRQLVPTRLFTHREFAFTLAGDIYLRYNSFANSDEMKKEVLRLNPSRFEIGAIYSARVRPASGSAACALPARRPRALFAAKLTAAFFFTCHSPRIRRRSALALFSPSDVSSSLIST